MIEQTRVSKTRKPLESGTCDQFLSLLLTGSLTTGTLPDNSLALSLPLSQIGITVPAATCATSELRRQRESHFVKCQVLQWGGDREGPKAPGNTRTYRAITPGESLWTAPLPSTLQTRYPALSHKAPGDCSSRGGQPRPLCPPESTAQGLANSR